MTARSDGAALHSLAIVVVSFVLLDTLSQIAVALAPPVFSEPGAMYTGVRLILGQASPWLLAAALVGSALATGNPGSSVLRRRTAMAGFVAALVFLVATIGFFAVAGNPGDALPPGQAASRTKDAWQAVASGLCLSAGLAGFGLMLWPRGDVTTD